MTSFRRLRGSEEVEPLAGRRLVIAVAAAVTALAAFPIVLFAGAGPPERLNFVLVLSDDQSPESLPHQPPPMPWLQGRMHDPRDHWIGFPRAFLNTPICCPSRATILSGQYSNHTGVETNADGEQFDDSSTLATWLHDGGYWTGLVGKYLNTYPFGRPPYVPPGWDRWQAKKGDAHFYYGYTLEQCRAQESCTIGRTASPHRYGSAPADYQTDVLRRDAVHFIQTAPQDRPFFLYYAPSAPHAPRTPAPRDVGAFSGMRPVRLPDFNERDIVDKPSWVRGLGRLGPTERRQEDRKRQQSYESLLDLDRSIRDIVAALRDRGALDHTVIVFLTDNGFSFGEHRYTGKACQYEECIHTPFLVRYPGARHRRDGHLVSNVDIAPTIAELAGVAPTRVEDGMSLVPLLQGFATPWRTAVLLHWAGFYRQRPAAFWGVRTRNYLYTELATGERELYDLTGRVGRADPYELDNRDGQARYGAVERRLAAELARLRTS